MALWGPWLGQRSKTGEVGAAANNNGSLLMAAAARAMPIRVNKLVLCRQRCSIIKPMIIDRCLCSKRTDQISKRSFNPESPLSTITKGITRELAYHKQASSATRLLDGFEYYSQRGIMQTSYYYSVLSVCFPQFVEKLEGCGWPRDGNSSAEEPKSRHSSEKSLYEYALGVITIASMWRIRGGFERSVCTVSSDKELS